MKMEYQAWQLSVCLKLSKKVSVVFRIIDQPFHTLVFTKAGNSFPAGASQPVIYKVIGLHGNR